MAQANVAAIRPDFTPPRLASLLPLRRALSEGKGTVDAAYAAVDRKEGRGRIADLWKIQAQLLQEQTAVAKAGLASLPSPSDTPLAELLRARIALLESDQITAALAFERAVTLGPGRDALWLDHANVLYSLGFTDRAKSYFRRLEHIGSRDGDVYYTLAMLSAAADEEDRAEQYLRRAWQMEPVERPMLVQAAVLWSTLRRPGVMEQISIAAPTEPRVPSTAVSSGRVMLPQGAVASTSGESLRVTLRDGGELHVPGGASLAPAGTRILSASESAQSEDAGRIADLPALLSNHVGPAAYAQPALRERMTSTLYALAERNRWKDIVSLTEGVTPLAEHVPSEVFYHRVVALQHLDRNDEATHLLAAVARSPLIQRRRDAEMLEQFAELFAARDLFDAAVRMYDRAQQLRPNPFIDERVRQILMNKRLATQYYPYKTAHFEIRYPTDLNVGSAMQVGRVLEREYQRLQAWVPTPSFKPVVVNVVSWEEFRATYTGNDFVLGFYNGKITVPFAGVDAEIPELTAILAHELSHAMIAQATADQAPHWFHEGFARRIEARSFHENAFNMYDDAKLLPISLLDAVLRSSPDPELISAAYIVAQTDIRFFETKYGRGALQRFLAAFREGATTEEVVRRVCGKSLEEVEVELRNWGRREQRVFTN
ncbi:MAG TPA: hypothetical protein VKB93_09375 [Thermoanaerobaculia bacterium]|nr:hypothetical protein [Thermoanaerobaculia bacterium]